MTQAVEIVAVTDFVVEDSVDEWLVTAFHSLVTIWSQFVLIKFRANLLLACVGSYFGKNTQLSGIHAKTCDVAEKAILAKKICGKSA